jgi:DNA-directed RNA polymerase subunit H (RpoH/RPB5)
MIDTSTHKLVPKHETLNKKEKKAVLERFEVTVDGLPKISSSDPAIKKMNPKAGDIVKILSV